VHTIESTVPMRRVYEFWQKVRFHRASEELVLELVAKQMHCSVAHVIASIAVCSPPLADPRLMKRRA
jgi:hypothetical protein